MTPEFGAPTQLEKIDMLDFANFVVINKFDKIGALDAVRDVKKQYQRNHQLFNDPIDSMPVYGTISSEFNNSGLNQFYFDLLEYLGENSSYFNGTQTKLVSATHTSALIPSNRNRYLSEISDVIRDYNVDVLNQSELAGLLFALK